MSAPITAPATCVIRDIGIGPTMYGMWTGVGFVNDEPFASVKAMTSPATMYPTTRKTSATTPDARMALER